MRGTRPNVGRSPVTPQRVLGDEMLPSVSLPMANGTSPAATALAGPALDPLEPWSGFHGLRVRTPERVFASSPLASVGPRPNHTSPCASSPSDSLATSTAPAASSRRTTSASSSIVCSRYGPAPHVVG